MVSAALFPVFFTICGFSRNRAMDIRKSIRQMASEMGISSAVQIQISENEIENGESHPPEDPGKTVLFRYVELKVYHSQLHDGESIATKFKEYYPTVRLILDVYHKSY